MVCFSPPIRVCLRAIRRCGASRSFDRAAGAGFRGAREPFEWKLHGHDRPADLPERLRAAGFVPEDMETVLIAPVSAIGIEAGMQFPIYRDTGPLYPRERYRFAINFAYFF